MEKTKFKIYCEDHGYTARYIAETVGISRFTVLAYMQGVRFPSRKTLKLMNERLEDFDYEIFI